MNIPSTPVSVSTEQALELVNASMNKVQQMQKGEMVLSLLEPVQAVTQSAAPAAASPSPNPRIGQQINTTA